MSSDDDYEWQPPSEAEMKLIQARRERSDKISKIMGDYLLKGYKMLGSSCELCGTILLRDRQSQDYCVGCNDLESDTDKDNPAVNTEAARSHEREYGLFPRSHLPQSSSDSPMEAAAPLTAPVSVSVLSQTQQVAGLSGVNCQPGDSRREVSSGLIAQTANTVVDAPLAVVCDKLAWATDQLKTCQCIETSIHLCSLIKTCADTIASLKSLQNNQLS